MNLFFLFICKVYLYGKYLKQNRSFLFKKPKNVLWANLVSPLPYQTGDSYNINTTGYGLSGNGFSM